MNDAPGAASAAENPASLIQAFSRYAALLDPLLRSHHRSSETDTTEESSFTFEAGFPFVDAAIDDGALLDDAACDRAFSSAPVQSGRVSAGAKSRRPFYRPLLVYAALQTFRVRHFTFSSDRVKRWDRMLRGWCDALAARLPVIPVPLSASGGASIAESAWSALALSAGGKVFPRERWTNLAAEEFARIAAAHAGDGPFLPTDVSDHPEVAWYHELAVLHAAASYAVQSGDRALARCVMASADFAAREIQPDHATLQPLGLFAFIWHAPARPLADGLLHAARLQPPDPPSLILLADALYCLQLFL